MSKKRNPKGGSKKKNRGLGQRNTTVPPNYDQLLRAVLNAGFDAKTLRMELARKADDVSYKLPFFTCADCGEIHYRPKQHQNQNPYAPS